ncbi:Anthranilate synthase component 1 [invertebrate metagenome]|uniref:Anthranilate synthase component 1 n=1 Tax=invertebrate metagenome TaxID=1711999 RepID=A0A2H9TCQ1_9ZZZZ
MTPETFIQLKKEGYTRVPVTRKILADLETPLTAYLKLANGAFSYLLESVEGGEKWGRYSIIGLPCHTVISVRDSLVQVKKQGQITEQHVTNDPLAFIRAFQQREKVAPLPDSLRFAGGLVGYFGYDMVRHIEPQLKASVPDDDMQLPDCMLLRSEDLLVFDNLSGYIILVTYADTADIRELACAKARLDKRVSRLVSTHVVSPASQANRPVQEKDFVSGFGQSSFERAVESIRDYIIAGDVMQVVLSQRMSADFHHSPLDLYRTLRCSNPSPYLYYLDMGEFHVVGSSPEILARLENNRVTVRPIAGTRKRGENAPQDVVLERELVNDPKERAEHLMLLDLGRNDVGRVAKTGTVTLTEKMSVERYSHVMHMVSNVTGTLISGLDAMDVLKATLPAGTLSGAPKFRAMEIIDELEPVKRGIYGGAVGYLGYNGNMDTAIAIRTAVIKQNKLYVQAGAGIVADSSPHQEWEETMSKGRALFQAVTMAQNGLIMGYTKGYNNAVDD